MKFAPVCNLASVGYIPFTGYHLVLSNQLIKHPRMAAFYARRVKKGDTVIIDNPVHERLEVPPITTVVSLVNEIQATHAVVPDVIGDPEQTIAQFDKYADYIRQAGAKPIGVVQGKNWKEYIDCIKAMAERTDVIGIPLVRRFEPIDRCMFIVRLTIDGFFNKYPDLRIHLLGADNTFSDARRLRDHNSVMGIDTAKPIYLAMKQIFMTSTMPKRVWGRPDDFFDLPEKVAWQNAEKIEHNVLYMKEYVAGAFDE